MTTHSTVATALVTGVGRQRGIGAAISRALIRDGWRVVACGWPDYDRRAPWTQPEVDHIDGLIAELEPSGRFQWHEFDLERPESAPTLFAAAEEVPGCIDALVAAHARSLPGGVLEVSADELDRHFTVNARSTALLIAEFARRWRGRPGSGRIVTVISGPPLVGEIAYATSKGAVEWLTLSAAGELASKGITVNAIDPGPTDTGWMSEETGRAALRTSPLGRVGTPTDAAELVAFLCSDRGGWITGQVLRSDGGWSRLRR